ncbi:kinase-like protein, partial [Hymenopellis radicata]
MFVISGFWLTALQDTWEGTMEGKKVCLKVLRLFLTGSGREDSELRLRKDYCREAMVWRQLRHRNVLPFLGVDNDLFAPSFCLISLWMENGIIVSFLKRNPAHDHLQAVCEIAQGIQYLHELDPQIVHGGIKGSKILVDDDLHCRLAGFSGSFITDSLEVYDEDLISRGAARWMAPEMMDTSLFDHSYVTAKDIYSFGCTILEIYTGQPPFSHIKTDAAVLLNVLVSKQKPPRPP